MKTVQFVVISLLFFLSTFIHGQTENCVCCTENHAAFDFWIGTWNVVDRAGAAVGTNRIEKLQDDCLLQENWTGTGRSTGTSINFFNSKSKQWEQLWVDNQGTYLKLKGNRKGNQMILSSDRFTHTDGNNYINRITWTINEDGTVRQLWEILKY